jgi:hypothetical protein
MIFSVAHQRFIVERKEGETGYLPERPRERECVCNLALQEKVFGIRCKTAACERVDFVVMRT